MDECPDTAGPLETFDVGTAGTEERARIRREALPILVEKASKLEPTPPDTVTAQSKYEQALAAQEPALMALREAIDRIAKDLNCDLAEEVREELVECFCKYVKAPRETEDDDLDLTCDPEAAESIEALRTRVAAITAAITWTAAQFDSLVGLPDELADEVEALATRATDLETALGGTGGTDPLRAFVELLRLRRDAYLLRRKLTSGREYGCRLRFLLVRLVELYTAAACLSGKLKEAEREQVLAEQRESKTEAALVDLVLQCAKPPPNGGEPPDWEDVDPCKECPGEPAQYAETSPTTIAADKGSTPTAQSPA
jgi:hypothetical protein